jgi:hypothetical protein
MFASRILQAAIIVVVAAVPAFAGTNSATGGQDDYRIVSRFLRAVDHYILVHHPVEVEPELMCLPEETLRELHALAVLRDLERPQPREGEIFVPEVADLFRRRLSVTLRYHDYSVADLLGEMDDEGPVAGPVVVNEPLAWGQANTTLHWITDLLPLLPEDVAYRLVGRDLVLVDVRTNLVVDVLRSAIAMK